MKKADEARLKKIHMLTLAFAIAFLPPFRAVLSPYVGVRTGAVALIAAGLYATNGNRRKDAVKITLGFLPGLVFTPALLCGWAIGLTIMAPLGTSAAS